ncbi:hypothetical protein CH330_03435 [candidate division WOR-3 bacterium JGI_Cruoil_03_51_56]|uniref:Hemerythrin-like domain-containing protein n=1 Tax=candidate division WOR-3 bacterium JGI_Cruoil_03_51_56 TaxID=1973747 RepID=A0A235BVG1_UNCW3|nr:MAG: hypothetical protein CH330_03435 [candidate division WOR-3 bacterium JGI_Cruoil_03_51_56]
MFQQSWEGENLHELLKALRTEHTELQRALAGIRPRQFRTDEGQERLNRVRELFRNYISSERARLYPALEKAAEQDKTLCAQIQRLDDDLKIVTDLAENFFKKYERGKPKLIEFATDHGALLTILKIRLKREEELIFPLFNKIAAT